MAYTPVKPPTDRTKAAIWLELQKLRSENVRLRNCVLAVAKECAECGGTGCVTARSIMGTGSEMVLPCPDCADLREALGQ